jgi:hypothetical protein
MGLRSGSLGGLPAGEFQRRERADELGMRAANVPVGDRRKTAQILGPEKLPASALDGDGHPAVKTGYSSPFFPLAASA